MDLSLDTSVQYLPKVGPTMAGRLENLGITTIKNLLYHFPFRYDDFTKTSPIANARPGQVVTLKGTIDSFKNIFTKNGKRLAEAKISDPTGHITVIWFNQMFLKNILIPGATVFLAGKVDWFGKTVAMYSPVYEITSDTDPSASLHTGRLVPVYPETEGVSSKWLRTRIAQALELYESVIEDFFPNDILTQYALLGRKEALQQIHFPVSVLECEAAKKRLAFEELFLTQLAAQKQKYEQQQITTAPRIKHNANTQKAFEKSLPFQLTADQKASIESMSNDMSNPYPMQRILLGDVGSGKTVVGAALIHAAASNGYQSILMAPTQILAEQHYKSISQLLAPHHMTVHLVTGTQKPDLNETPDVYVGTHALLTHPLLLPKLALVIIDEQQRFGVLQRELLTKKGNTDATPHVLTMTATPIPRTIAHTIYGNLDVSVLSSMPIGRQRVKTWVVPPEKREKAYAWIHDILTKTEGQAFIVCPLIEEGEEGEAVKSAKAEYERIKKHIFPTLRVGLLHGRMKPFEKTSVLTQFRNHTYDVLVTTSVVEVGIDIPNAVIMMIEASDRFGLAQLHQLRGRVGRGEKQSFCLLFTESAEERSIQRLKALETIYSGPELAELDFMLRGSGDIFGTKQHGLPAFRIATLTDLTLLSETQQAAKAILLANPTLADFPLLRQELQNSTIGDVSIG